MSQISKKLKISSSVSWCHKHKESCEGTSRSRRDTLNDNGSLSIFLVPEGIQSKRYQLIRSFASKNGFHCNEDISDNVSHLVSELKDINQLCRLYPVILDHFDLKIVSTQWLHTCVRQKSVVPEEDFLIPGYYQWVDSRRQNAQLEAEHKRTNHEGCVAASTDIQKQLKFDKEQFNENILERKAPLDHCNQALVEPLLFLNEYWTVMGDERRALAYAKAAATIKCLPFTVTAVNEVEDLKGLGTGHCMKVIQETIETGRCQEVSAKRNSEKFQILKNVSSVYGIGPSLALKLHNIHDIKSVQDIIKQWNHMALADERIKVGVVYHGDLSTPVPKDLAEKIKNIVESEISTIKPGFSVELAGGFRRGKLSGHDVDLLITFKENGDESDVLPKVIKQLNQKNFMIHWRLEKSSFDEEVVFRKHSDQVTTMDHFEKCFCVFRCPLQSNIIPAEEINFNLDVGSSVSTCDDAKRSWRAVRVDLIIIPKCQWAYALLGWTGSKLLMRMLRQYSNTVLHRSLNSHGLWDKRENRLLPAATEKEVFANLGLSYKEPTYRNF